jgi:hypothetical protein
MVAKLCARRKFSSVWQEIDYLHKRVEHWFCVKCDRQRAAPFAKRLATLLTQEASAGATPFTEGVWALLCEVQEDLAAAIVHREKEIRLLKRLFEVAIAQANFDLVVAYYDYQDLVDRLDKLAVLYRGAGRIDDAIKTCEEARRLAATHGLKFAGEALLKDCKEIARVERRPRHARPRGGPRRRTTSS